MVHVWDAMTEALLDTYETEDAVTAVAITERRVYAGLRNGKVQAWERKGGGAGGGRVHGQGYGHGHVYNAGYGGYGGRGGGFIASASSSSGGGGGGGFGSSPLYELGGRDHGHAGAVYSVAVGEGDVDGNGETVPLVATASVDRTARVWCGDTGRLLTTVEADEEGVMSVALASSSADASGGAGAAGSRARPLLVTGGLDGHVRVWDCRTGAGVMAWKAHGDWIRSLATYGDRVATAGRGRRSTSVLIVYSRHTCN